MFTQGRIFQLLLVCLVIVMGTSCKSKAGYGCGYTNQDPQDKITPLKTNEQNYSVVYKV